MVAAEASHGVQFAQGRMRICSFWFCLSLCWPRCVSESIQHIWIIFPPTRVSALIGGRSGERRWAASSVVGGHRRPHRRPHFFSFVVVLVGSPAERWSSSSFMVRRRAVGTNPGASTRAAAGQLGLIQGGGPWTRLQESRRDPGQQSQNNLP